MENTKTNQRDYYKNINKKIMEKIFLIKFNVIFYFIYALSIHSFCFSQTNNTLLPKQNTGVYLNSKSYLDQIPFLAKSQLIVYNSEPHSIKSWSKADSLYYTDLKGRKKSISIDSIWGICENNELSIQHNKSFHKVKTIGMISLFNETINVIIAPNSPISMDQSKDIEQYFSDLSTGIIYPYKVEAFKHFLSIKDQTLFSQFMNYRNNKKRRKVLYHFIELYNKKNPIL